MKMDRIEGRCLGTGAIINICCGFTPRKVKLFVHDASDEIWEIDWKREWESDANCAEGLLYNHKTPGTTMLTATNGISRYAGGDRLTYDESQTRWETDDGTDATEEYVYGSHKVQGAPSGAPNYLDIGTKENPSLQDGAVIRTPKGFTIAAALSTNDVIIDWEAWM